MAAPHWQRVKDVFQDAVVRAPEARPAFLDEACDGDAELRREVDSLLASHGEAGGFLSRPAPVETEPEPSHFMTRTGTRVAPGADPTLVPVARPATNVPCP